MTEEIEVLNMVPEGDIWTVSGQSLWYFLGSKGRYQSWFKKVAKAGAFFKNEDYYVEHRLKKLPEDGAGLVYIHDDLMTISRAVQVLVDSGKDGVADAVRYISGYRHKEVPEPMVKIDHDKMPIDEFSRVFMGMVIDNYGMDPMNHFALIKDIVLSNDIERIKKPMERFYDLVSAPGEGWDVTAFAMNWGVSAQEMNKYMERYGIQKRVNGRWVLTDAAGYNDGRLMKKGSKWTLWGYFYVFCILLDNGWRPNVQINLDTVEFPFEVLYWLTHGGLLTPKYQTAKNEETSQN